MGFSYPMVTPANGQPITSHVSEATKPQLTADSQVS